MAAYPDLPVQPQSSEFHARRWNIRSDGWASINTGRSDPPPTETIENSVAWHLRNWLKRRIVTKATIVPNTLGIYCAELYLLPMSYRGLGSVIRFPTALPPRAREKSTRAHREGIEPIQRPHLRNESRNEPPRGPPE